MEKTEISPIRWRPTMSVQVGKRQCALGCSCAPGVNPIATLRWFRPASPSNERTDFPLYIKYLFETQRLYRSTAPSASFFLLWRKLHKNILRLLQKTPKTNKLRKEENREVAGDGYKMTAVCSSYLTGIPVRFLLCEKSVSLPWWECHAHSKYHWAD